jgi:hypothetical protein
MNDYQTFAYSPNLTIEVLPHARGFSLSDHEKLLIENIWRHEENLASSLHNGQIFNVISLEGDKIIGEFVEYKYYLAQQRDTNFEPALQIKTLSISGITTTVDKILVGQRSATVTTYQNYYELVPSGGIDPRAQQGNQINIKRQFELELWEESGISVTEIKSIKPVAIFYDLKNKIYEACAELNINYTILKESLHPSDEYQKLEWISKREIQGFVQKHSHEFVPFSIYLLEEYKKKSLR